MPINDLVEPVLQSIAKAERHMRSEYGTKMVGVMDTIAARPHFAMMLAPGVVKVCSGRDEVDAMYKASVDFAEPRVSRILSQFATDWYMFMENLPTRFWVDEGVERTAQTVNIFMSDDVDGLTGEYAWQRYYAPGDVLGSDSEDFPIRALENLQLHEMLLEALCAGDQAGLAEVLDPACLWAQRNYLSDVAGGEIAHLQGVDAVARHVTEWHAAFLPTNVSVLNRKVADWFVFAEELWVVRLEGREMKQYRVASIYPVNLAGKFEGALGFGKNVEALSPSASQKLGLSVFPRKAALLRS
jgi:hypothetical protein